MLKILKRKRNYHQLFLLFFLVGPGVEPVALAVGAFPLFGLTNFAGSNGRTEFLRGCDHTLAILHLIDLALVVMLNVVFGWFLCSIKLFGAYYFITPLKTADLLPRNI